MQRLSPKCRGLRRYFMGRVRIIFGLALLCAVGVVARADSSSADRPHVHVALLVSGDSLYSSDDLNRVGLYFKLEPGWHIYWKNPGDAGEAPRIQWTLPDGISATSMQFPAPKRLPLGPLMDYGYEDEVLFPLKLHVAESVKAGLATLHAHVVWLVCQSSCIPGKADLEVKRDVYRGLYDLGTPPASLDWEFLRRNSKSLPELPKPFPPGSKVVFHPTGDGFRLTVQTGKRETEASFFPADQDVVDNPAPQKFSATAQGFTLDLKKDSSLKAAPAQLRGVLELSGGRAYEIAALPGAATTVRSVSASEPSLRVQPRR